MTWPKPYVLLALAFGLVCSASSAQPAHTPATSRMLAEILKYGPSKTYLVTSITDSLLKLPYDVRMQHIRILTEKMDSALSSNSRDRKAIVLYMKAWLEGPILNTRKLAMETLFEGLRIADNLKDDYLQFLFLEQILQTKVSIGEYIEVTKDFKELRDRFNKLDRTAFPGYDRPDEMTMKLNVEFTDKRFMNTMNTTGTAYLTLGSIDSAMMLFEEARAYAIKVGNEDWTAIAESNIGLVYQAKGNYSKALAAINSDYRHALARRDWRAACEIVLRMAHLKVLLNDIEGANKKLDTVKLLMKLDPEQQERLEINYTKVSVELAAASNNYHNAYELYKQYMKASEAANEKRQSDAIKDVEKGYNFSRNQEDIRALKFENESKTKSVDLHKFLSIATVVAAILVAALAINFTMTLRRQRRATRVIREHRDEIKNKNKELETALENLKAAQQQLVHSEKMSSLGQLTAGLVHEINNPVNFVQSGSESMQENLKILTQMLSEYEKIDENNVRSKLAELNKLRDDLQFDEIRPEIQTLLNVIRKGSERTTAIISRLNRFSSNDKEEFVEIPIATPIEETLGLLVGELKNKVTVVIDLEPGLTVMGSSVELAQVFMNIIMNATQAMKGGGTINIKTTRLDQQVQVSISDTGPGIPAEVLGKIFDPFFTTKEVGKGMGLGLSISHGIIEAHDGEISVRNREGGGAEFIIRIPIARQSSHT